MAGSGSSATSSEVASSFLADLKKKLAMFSSFNSKLIFSPGLFQYWIGNFSRPWINLTVK